jgi:hypothetical protein
VFLDTDGVPGEFCTFFTFTTISTLTALSTSRELWDSGCSSDDSWLMPLVFTVQDFTFKIYNKSPLFNTSCEGLFVGLHYFYVKTRPM